MAPGPSPEPPPSLFRITVRRAMVAGRFYLIIATGISLLFSISLGFAGETAFGAVVPFFLPLYATMGGLGGLMVFTNDRIKGVYEYLLAYGITPRQVFMNILGASAVLVTIVFAIALTAGLGAYLGSGHPATLAIVTGLLGYAVPMTYASGAFAGTAGMYWTSLSSPREGMSSPIGLAPLIGVAPPLLTFLAVLTVGIGRGAIVAVAGLLSVIVIVVVLLSLVERLLPRERLLSPS